MFKPSPALEDDDPLAHAIAPPPNESPEARQARVNLEKKAKLRSDAIDEELNRQRSAEKKGGKPIKVLLLGAFLSLSLFIAALTALSGQSESGIIPMLFLVYPHLTIHSRQIDNAEEYVSLLSTHVCAPTRCFCSDFQLISSPKVCLETRSLPSRNSHSFKAFREERGLWRAVIQLNVARSIRLILDTMTAAQAPPESQSPPFLDSPLSPQGDYGRPFSPPPATATGYPPLSPEHLKLKMRLGPLLQVEKTLWRKLSPEGTVDLEGTRLASTSNLPSVYDRAKSEYSVNSASGWRGAFGRLLTGGEPRNSIDSHSGINFDDPDDPGLILYNCADDMNRLWNDPTIRSLLELQKLRLEDMPGLFVH
jgi:guanine nucleotide-binding protein alpha-1 subunit